MTVGDDTTARLWDARTAQPLGKPMLHDAPVRAMAISPDGKTLVTGSADRVLRWSAQSGERLGEPWKFSGEVRKVDFSADGKALLVHCATRQVSNRGVARFSIWRNSVQTAGIRRRKCAARQLPGSTVGRHRAIQGRRFPRAQIWNLQSGQAMGQPLRHESMVTLPRSVATAVWS